MDNPFKSSDLFAGSSELPIETMLLYLDGKLDEQDKREVEKQLADNPLLMESLEGLEMMSKEERNSLAPLLLGLGADIDAKASELSSAGLESTPQVDASASEAAGTASKGGILRSIGNMKWMAAAAVVLIVGAAGFYIYKQQQNMDELFADLNKPAENTITDDAASASSEESADLNWNIEGDDDAEPATGGLPAEMTPPPAPPPPPALDIVEEVIEEEITFAEAEDTKLEWRANIREDAEELPEPKPVPGAANKKGDTESIGGSIDGNKEGSIYDIENKPISSAPVYTETVTATEAKKKPIRAKKKNTKSEKSYEAPKLDDKVDRQSNTMRSVQELEEDPAVVKDAYMEEAMKLYDAGNHKEAISYFERILALDPDNSAANFYQANSYLQTDQAEESLDNLSKVSKDPKDPFFEQARWYLALTHMSLGDRRKAKKVLNQIVNSGGTYATQAKEALDKL